MFFRARGGIRQVSKVRLQEWPFFSTFRVNVRCEQKKIVKKNVYTLTISVFCLQIVSLFKFILRVYSNGGPCKNSERYLSKTKTRILKY
jgi:hypothetical protein